MEQKYVLKCTYGIVICLSIALLVSSDASMNESKTCCTDSFSLYYILPTFFECQKKGHPNGSMVQTIAMFAPNSYEEGGCPRRESKLGVPPGRRVCRFPVDTTPPVVQSCPSNQTFLVITTTTPITWTPPTASDASGIASIVANYEPGVNVSVNSPIDVIYTVTDNSGLVNTICSFNITLVSVETEWKCTSSKCYRLRDAKPQSWQNAHDFCPTLGPITTVAGDRTPSLLFEDSEEASQLALNLVGANSSINYVWINCNDIETEGLFMCDVDGTGAVQINTTNWGSGEPGGNVNENCVTLARKYQNKWDDMPCSFEFNSICQIVL